MTFSTADAAFNFNLNGKYLDGSSTNSSAAMAAAVSVNFGTDTSALQNKLNTLMTTLNGVHPEAVFEYEIDGTNKALTFDKEMEERFSWEGLSLLQLIKILQQR